MIGTPAFITFHSLRFTRSLPVNPPKVVRASMSWVSLCDLDELREGQAVTFEKGQGPKGPRGENVKVV